MPTAKLTIVDDFHGDYEDDLLHSAGENSQVSGRLGGSPLMRDTIELLSHWVGNYDQCGRKELELLGRYLYTVAFGDDCPSSGGPTGATGEPSPLRRAFERAYTFYRQKGVGGCFRLQLVIGGEARQLGSFPWEFLFMPQSEGGFFLAGERSDFVLTRYVPNEDDSKIIEERSVPGDEGSDRMRILVVLSRPQAPGAADIEAGKLVDAIKKLRSSDTDVEELQSPTRQELRQRLEAYPAHIVHFIGHGKDNALTLKKSEWALAQERLDRMPTNSHGSAAQELDEADPADSRSVCSLFCHGLDSGPGLERTSVPRRLIFLHSCYGAAVRPSGNALRSLSSIARDLAGKEGISAVIAMQYAIASEDAERFAIRFYHWIGSGKRVDDAVSWARRELGEISSRGRQVWDDPCFGTPVIYVRRAGVFFPRRLPARSARESGWPQGHRPASYTGGGLSSAPRVLEDRRPGIGRPRDPGRSAERGIGYGAADAASSSGSASGYTPEDALLLGAEPDMGEED
ncbi:CHAT domain-containing protein [Streptomyces sp. NPDC057302]|uniref:CHAT domain-containing protein n=1 Tax=Streptomyces sp. NPDC057302 TaxID=3346094 RepID=UPI0036332EA8